MRTHIYVVVMHVNESIDCKILTNKKKNDENDRDQQQKQAQDRLVYMCVDQKDINDDSKRREKRDRNLERTQDIDSLNVK